MLLLPVWFIFLQDDWYQDLRRRLDAFLKVALRSLPQPRLFDLYVSFATLLNKFIINVGSYASLGAEPMMIFVSVFNKLSFAAFVCSRFSADWWLFHFMHFVSIKCSFIAWGLQPTRDLISKVTSWISDHSGFSCWCRPTVLNFTLTLLKIIILYCRINELSPRTKRPLIITGCKTFCFTIQSVINQITEHLAVYCE